MVPDGIVCVVEAVVVVVRTTSPLLVPPTLRERHKIPTQEEVEAPVAVLPVELDP